MNNRYQRKLEEKRALQAQRLKTAKSVDGSEREIASRLHLDGRNQMEAPLTLENTAVPPDGNQAVPKAQILLLNGEQGMAAPLYLDRDTAVGGTFPFRRSTAAPLGELLDTKADLNNSIDAAEKSAKSYTDTQLKGYAKASHEHKATDITGLKLPKGTAAALTGEYRHSHTLTFGS